MASDEEATIKQTVQKDEYFRWSVVRVRFKSNPDLKAFNAGDSAGLFLDSMAGSHCAPNKTLTIAFWYSNDQRCWVVDGFAQSCRNEFA